MNAQAQVPLTRWLAAWRAAGSFLRRATTVTCRLFTDEELVEDITGGAGSTLNGTSTCARVSNSGS
jgi:hypothetical protein